MGSKMVEIADHELKMKIKFNKNQSALFNYKLVGQVGSICLSSSTFPDFLMFRLFKNCIESMLSCLISQIVKSLNII